MNKQLNVNGQERAVQANTVLELLRAEEVDETARFVAVAINGSVVPRGQWESRSLVDGDDIEIVKPVSGG